MKRWLLPIIYFVFCESLDLFYEIGLIGQFETIGVISALILVMITMPAQPIEIWIEQHAATWLGLPFGEHSFWPRMLGMQSMILTCTITLFFLTWFLKAVDKYGNHPPNP